MGEVDKDVHEQIMPNVDSHAESSEAALPIATVTSVSQEASHHTLALVEVAGVVIL